MNKSDWEQFIEAMEAKPKPTGKKLLAMWFSLVAISWIVVYLLFKAVVWGYAQI